MPLGGKNRLGSVVKSTGFSGESKVFLAVHSNDIFLQHK